MTTLTSDNGHQPIPQPSSAPLKTPFPAPSQASKPPPEPKLSEAQEAKYQQLLSTVLGWTSIPTTSGKDASTAPLSDDERMWLSRECLLRYLRAVKWNSTEAPKRLISTVIWRREYGVAKHTAEYISPENETGKHVILGYDYGARPCLYLRPSKQNTERSDRQLQHLVFSLERAIDLMVPGQDNLALLVDFKDTGGSMPNIAQGRQALNILQGHYPERLGRSLFINIPWAVWGFFKIISPLMDPLTREKMIFNDDLRKHVPPEHLWNTMGGDLQFEYEHSTYWPALINLAAERREAYRERWIRGGKRIGEHEGYLKGGAEPSVAQMNLTSTEQASLDLKTIPSARTNGDLPVDGVPDVSGLKVGA